MIEFVGLALTLETHIRGCPGNHAFLHSPYQNCFRRTSFHIQTLPLNNLAWIKKALGIKGIPYLNPYMAYSFYVIFPHFLSFHVFSWICKSYMTTGWMDLSNCNIDVMKTCHNDNIGMKSAYLQLLSKIFIDSDFCHNYLHNYWIIRRASKKTVVGIYKVINTVHCENTLRIEAIECFNNESLDWLWCMCTSWLHKLYNFT